MRVIGGNRSNRGQTKEKKGEKGDSLNCVNFLLSGYRFEPVLKLAFINFTFSDW